MPKRKILRTPAEEKEYKKMKRQKQIELNNFEILNVPSTSKNKANNSNIPSRNKSTGENNSNQLPPNDIKESLPRITISPLINELLPLEQFVHNENTVSEHYLGRMNILCTHCNACHFPAEQVANKKNSFNDCCSHGEVLLENLPDMPLALKSLFDGTHEKSNHFYERIRYYNSSFSFASFNANLVQFNNRRPGPFCFKIQGQIYYQIKTSLYPESSESPTNGQLFIIDSNEASQYQLKRNSNLDLNIVATIESVLRECNIFALSYQMMKDELDAEQAKYNNTEPELQLLFTLKPGMQRSRYNFQRVNEVAAVFSTTADGDIPESYVTIKNKNTKKLQIISTMVPNVEHWVYPLFYPYGT
ncbi:uncharacterized protein LOC130670458 [Microplitis mediator]|uniref:uncharacterized protein LOC130670458 n=1 Tax=Microplitis mediator TaxID=375433 RepID=UPI002556BA34|nr:uncharacterized protein LOC130670458 [Microplitis mediator]